MPLNEEEILSECFFKYVFRHISHQFQSVIEIGCGNGLAAKKISNIAQHILLIDTDPKATNKTSTYFSKERNVKTQCISSSDVTGTYDMAYYFMSLHHIENIYTELTQAKRFLVAGGILIICDYYPCQLKPLHFYDKVPHEGLAPEYLKETLVKLNFTNIHYENITTLSLIKNEETIKYPIYVMTGKNTFE